MTTRSGSYNIDVNFNAANANRGVRDINTGMGEMHDKAKMVAEFFAGTLQTFANFEQAMAEVKAISGATGDEFIALTERAREMGRVTVFTAQESAEALKFISMAGIDAKTAIEILPDILNLAAAGALDLGKAADLATNIMTVFGKEAGDMTNITDILAHTAASSNTNIQQLASAISYAGPIARAAGITMEELSAAVGTLGSAGIQGYRAGTGLRSMITSLVKPTKMARDTFESLGIKITDSAGNMRGALDLIGDLTAVGASASDLARIFTSRSVPAVKAMMNAMEAGELQPFIDSMYDVDGAAKKMADTMLDTTKGSVTLLKSKLTDLALTIGESLAPVLNHILDHLNKFVGWIGKAAEAHPKLFTAISVVVGVLAVLLTGITGVGVALAGLGIALPLIGVGFTGVAAAATAAWIAITGPIGLIVAGIAALAAVVGVVLFKAWKGNSEALRPVKELMQAVVEVAKALWERVKQLWSEAIKPLIAAFVDLGKLLAPIIIPVIKILIALFSTQLKVAINIITGVLKILAALIRGDFMGAWNALKNTVISVAKSIIGGIGSILKALPDKFIPDGWIRSIERAEESLENAMNNMSDKSDETNKQMQTGIGNTSMEMKHQFGEMEKSGTDSLTAVENKSGELQVAMKEDATAAQEGYTRAGDTIETQLSGNLDTAKSKTEDLTKTTEDGATKKQGFFKKVGEALKNHVIENVNQTKKNFQDLGRVTGQVATFMWNGLKTSANNIKTALTMATDVGKRVIGYLGDTARRNAEDIRRRFSDAGQRLGDAIRRGSDIAKRGIGWLSDGVRNASNKFSNLRSAGSRALDVIRSGARNASSVVSSLGNVISRVISGFGRLISAARNAANRARSIISNIASRIPGLAEGGIVKARPGGTPVIIGEGGKDEAVIPLESNYNNVKKGVNLGGAPEGDAPAGGTGGGAPVVQGQGMGDTSRIEYLLQDLIKTVKMTNTDVFIGEKRLDDITFNSNVRNNNIRRTERTNPWV